MAAVLFTVAQQCELFSFCSPATSSLLTWKLGKKEVESYIGMFLWLHAGVTHIISLYNSLARTSHTILFKGKVVGNYSFPSSQERGIWYGICLYHSAWDQTANKVKELRFGSNLTGAQHSFHDFKLERKDYGLFCFVFFCFCFQDPAYTWHMEDTQNSSYNRRRESRGGRREKRTERKRENTKDLYCLFHNWLILWSIIKDRYDRASTFQPYNVFSQH